MTRTAPVVETDGELSRAMERFEGLGRELVVGYEALARRAERVERELEHANHALEHKVGELARVTADLEALLAALPLGVVVRDGAGRVTRSNPAAARLLACDERALAAGELDAELDGLSARAAPVERTDRTGQVRTLAVRTARVPARDGARAGEVCLVDDQTEHQRLAARLHTQDKLAALGTLAAGVAHEIRNPLSAVLGFASLLARDLPEGSKARRWADMIVTGATETDHIVSGLLTFAAPGNVAIESVDLASLVADVLAAETARRERAERWTVTSDVAAPAVLGDRVKLRQALRNLVANAFEAQPRGGAVHVAVAAGPSGLAITVDDAGPGVPAADRQRVLEPFFTTRDVGTGLGLALTHTVARLHGGVLDLAPERSPLGGARFVLLLPSACLPDAR